MGRILQLSIDGQFCVAGANILTSAEQQCFLKAWHSSQIGRQQNEISFTAQRVVMTTVPLTTCRWSIVLRRIWIEWQPAIPKKVHTIAETFRAYRTLLLEAFLWPNSKEGCMKVFHRALEHNVRELRNTAFYCWWLVCSVVAANTFYLRGSVEPRRRRWGKSFVCRHLS